MEWVLILLVVVAAWMLYQLLSDILEKLQELQRDVEVIKDKLLR